jgi:hypothetical protein
MHGKRLIIGKKVEQERDINHLDILLLWEPLDNVIVDANEDLFFLSRMRGSSRDVSSFSVSLNIPRVADDDRGHNEAGVQRVDPHESIAIVLVEEESSIVAFG